MFSKNNNMTKTDLFIELANPGKDGKSRWVSVNEFTGKYAVLQLGNGGSWCRASSSLAKKYIVEFEKGQTKGNSIDAIRLNGHKKETTFNQNIRKDIKDYYKTQRCVMLGVCGFSENTKIEIDHKEGTKNSSRVSNVKTQTIEDFQPVCKACNDIKREICKRCKETDIRWDATQLEGFPFPYYKGNSSLKESGCEGCYQYDPVMYRKVLVERLRNGE